VLLIGCSSTKAYEIGERIRKTVEEHRFSLLDGGFIDITVSIGLATFIKIQGRIIRLKSFYPEKGLVMKYLRPSKILYVVIGIWFQDCVFHALKKY
jgi:hypothetical protein